MGVSTLSEPRTMSLFFSSEESGNKWTANHENTFLFILDQAHEIGRLTDKATFGDALHENFSKAVPFANTCSFYPFSALS